MAKKIQAKFKKKVEEFLLEEDGKVSKADIIKTGIAVAAASTLLATEVTAGHTNNLGIDGNNQCISHTNHSNHASHASY